MYQVVTESRMVARMTNRNATFAKRQREQAQKEKARLREQKKAERRAKAAMRVLASDDDVDPDLVGIVPGPQPRSDE